MNVVFRVDASARMGVGHIMRCLALAQSLRERGAQLHFICREHSGNLISLLQQKDMPVSVLSAPDISNTVSGEDYAAWLGVNQAEDAEQTIAVLNGEKPDWLVVDHYALNDEWEKQLRPYASKLMVVDDLANRHHDCDLLLDQNYSPEGEQRYAGLLPRACKLLIGPRYALLRPEYAEYRKSQRSRGKGIKKIMVFFGGTDPQNMTGITLDALSSTELKHLEVDVVVGANNPHRKNIELQVLGRAFTTLHEPRAHLADLIANADLAIGAGGVTTWERMCLGLPAVVISIAENQRPGAKALAAAQLIHYAGQASEITSASIAQEVVELVSNPGRLSEMSEQAQLMVDGLGTLRVQESLFPTGKNKIQIREARQNDVITYFNWVNDLEVRKNSTDTAKISWKDHQKWFEKKLIDPNSHLYVIEVEGLPIGQIRFDKGCKETRIDYSLDKLVRGRGWGVKLVSLGLDMLKQHGDEKLLAEVKASNTASYAVFMRLGFTMHENKNGYYIFQRSNRAQKSLIES